jgi:hypothetical protein
MIQVQISAEASANTTTAMHSHISQARPVRAAQTAPIPTATATGNAIAAIRPSGPESTGSTASVVSQFERTTVMPPHTSHGPSLLISPPPS